MACGKPVGKHGQRRIDLDSGAGDQLPCRAREQVGAHRQVAVREIKRLGGAAAVGVVIGLQVDRFRFEILDPVEQPGQPGLLAIGIGIVHIVERDIDDPFDRLVIPAISRLLAELAHHDAGIPVIGDQQAPDLGQRHIGRVGAVVQGEVDAHAELVRGADQRRVIHAVGPDHRAHPDAGVGLDEVGALLQVASDPGFVLLVGFIALQLGKVQVRAGCRQLIALGIGYRAVVHIVRVRSDFHQTGRCHLAQVVPAHEVARRHHRPMADTDRLVPRCIGPARHHRDHGGIVVLPQQRKGLDVLALVGIVEAQQHGARRQERAAVARGDDLVDADRMEVVALEPGEDIVQGGGADRAGISHGSHIRAQVVADIVERQHAEGQSVVAIPRRQQGQDIACMNAMGHRQSAGESDECSAIQLAHDGL